MLESTALSILQSAITLFILSFNAPISYSILDWFAILNIPSLLNSRLMVTPAKINKTTMVTTSAINVIAFSCTFYISCSS